MKGMVDGLLEVSVVGSFSRLGYETRSRMQPWDTHYRLAGNRMLITGGTTGLGYAAAREAVAAGAVVAITGRDPGRTAAAAERIGAVPLAADAADLDAMAGLIDRASSELGGLDTLVNNAGALDADYTLSPQGFETTYAVHVLAPFLLTALARERVQTVIAVSSGGMYSQRLDSAVVEMTAEDYDGVTAYARAKRAQVALTSEWARRHPGRPTFAAMHPGWADTPGVQRSLPTFRRVTGPILRTPEQGCDTMLWLAGHAVPSGLFWLDRAPRSTVRLPWLRYGQDEMATCFDMVAEQVRPWLGAATL